MTARLAPPVVPIVFLGFSVLYRPESLGWGQIWDFVLDAAGAALAFNPG